MMKARVVSAVLLAISTCLFSCAALAEDEYCAERPAGLTPRNQCFDSLAAAESFIRTEHSPAIGAPLLRRSKKIRQGPAGYVFFDYVVDNTKLERFRGSSFRGSGVAPGGNPLVVCSSAALNSSQPVCEDEQEFAKLLLTTWPYGPGYTARYTGRYQEDPPVRWSSSNEWAIADLNALPSNERRMIIAVSPGGITFANSHERLDSYTCPATFYAAGFGGTGTPVYPWPKVCLNSTQAMIRYQSKQYKSCGDGNPCIAATGNKEYREADFTWEGLSFSRSYNSIRDMPLVSGMGDNWAHSFSDRLLPRSPFTTDIYWLRSDGYFEVFEQLSETTYRSRNLVGITIYREPEGATLPARWRLVDGNRTLWFDESSRLVRVEVGDRYFDLKYCAMADHVAKRCVTPDSLIAVVSQTGRQLKFGRVEKPVNIDPAGVNKAPESLITSIESDGVVLATYDYDDMGRLVKANGGSVSGRGKDYLYAEPNNLCRDAQGTVSVGCDTMRFPYHLTGVLNELGNRSANYRYDQLGRVTLSEHAGGVGRVALSYLANGDTQVTLPNGALKLYKLSADPFRKATSIRTSTTDGSVGATTAYTNVGMRTTQTISSNGSATKYSYSAAHEIERKEGLTPAGATTSYTRTFQTDWHPTLGRPTEYRTYDSTNALVSKQALTYNDRGQVLVTQSVEPKTNEVRSSTTSYCEQSDVAVSGSNCPIIGLVKSIDGPRSDVSDVTTYKYYAADEASCAATPATCLYRKGDLWTVINAAGQIEAEHLRYDYAGRVLSTLDANGVVTDREYNARGWLTATKIRGVNDAVETDDRITKIEYWPTGSVKKIILPDGASLSYGYDAAQQLVEISDSDSNKIQYTLNSTGNRVKEETKTAAGDLKQTLSRVYNELGQLQISRDSSQNATGYRYDSQGNRDRTVDALGNAVERSYDSLDRLKRTLEDVGGLNVETAYEYDALDRLTKVVDPKGLQTKYAYNGFGERTQVLSPDTGKADYVYSAAGRMLSRQDEDGLHRYTYDVLNRLKAVYYTDTGPADVAYEYDFVSDVCASDERFAIGHLTVARAGDVTLKYCYNRFGYVVRKVQQVGQTSLALRYEYSIGGRLKAMTYPDGSRIDYVLDRKGRITEVGLKQPGGSRVVVLTGATYEPFGPVSGWAFGNGRQLSRTYDLNYRAKSVFATGGAGLALDYEYNKIGKQIELKESAVSTKYDYDAIGRLNVARDGLTNVPLETYGYDSVGNRTSLLRTGVSTSYEYSMSSHHLLSVGGIPRTYGPTGNTTSIGGTDREFVYGLDGRLSKVKRSGAVVSDYRYNAFGERVGTLIPGGEPAETLSLYDEGGNWVGDYGVDGVAKQQVVWMGAVPVAVMPQRSGGSSALYYIESDRLGAPRTVIDPLRNVPVWSWSARGETFGADSPNQDPDLDSHGFVFDLRFPGQRYDRAAGLNYNYMRSYMPDVGRYLESDPVGLKAGVSTYAYVKGDPVSGTDRTGLFDGADVALVKHFLGRSGTYLDISAWCDDYVSDDDVIRNADWLKGEVAYRTREVAGRLAVGEVITYEKSAQYFAHIDMDKIYSFGDGVFHAQKVNCTIVGAANCCASAFCRSGYGARDYFDDPVDLCQTGGMCGGVRNIVGVPFWFGLSCMGIFSLTECRK